MTELYWACLIGGSLFAVLTVLLGDLGGHGGHDIAHDHDGFNFLKPAVIVSAVAAFGGAGLMLTSYTTIGGAAAFSVALVVGVFIAVGVYFLYIKPMMRSENSVAFSVHDLVGITADVITTIPNKGHGEVLLRVGGSVTNQIAASADGVEIRSGSRVVVVEIIESTLYVTAVDNI